VKELIQSGQSDSVIRKELAGLAERDYERFNDGGALKGSL
jgi:hypothetical protein